jgi:hypothetical protein
MGAKIYKEIRKWDENQENNKRYKFMLLSKEWNVTRVYKIINSLTVI